MAKLSIEIYLLQKTLKLFGYIWIFSKFISYASLIKILLDINKLNNSIHILAWFLAGFLAGLLAGFLDSFLDNLFVDFWMIFTHFLYRFLDVKKTTHSQFSFPGLREIHRNLKQEKNFNSRESFFRKSPFCTFSWINPGFGGPWDKLWIFFLVAIFIMLQKNAFGQKKFWISCTGSKVPFWQFFKHVLGSAKSRIYAGKVQKGDFLKKDSRELDFLVLF